LRNDVLKVVTVKVTHVVTFLGNLCRESSQIATDRRDVKAEQIAEIYKLSWNIENFFAWWKRHLRVYHLIARSPYGLMVQILAGLITSPFKVVLPIR
jgi:IS4 transposase